MARDNAYRNAEKKIEEARRTGATELSLSRMGLTDLLESLGQLTQLQILTVHTNPTLLHASTPESIRHDFAAISFKEMRNWVSQKLGKTLASKRQTAYQEFRNAA